jgi:hypothetical protein
MGGVPVSISGNLPDVGCRRGSKVSVFQARRIAQALHFRVSWSHVYVPGDFRKVGPSVINPPARGKRFNLHSPNSL